MIPLDLTIEGGQATKVELPGVVTQEGPGVPFGINEKRVAIDAIYCIGRSVKRQSGSTVRIGLSTPMAIRILNHMRAIGWENHFASQETMIDVEMNGFTERIITNALVSAPRL